MPDTLNPQEVDDLKKEIREFLEGLSLDHSVEAIDAAFRGVAAEDYGLFPEYDKVVDDSEEPGAGSNVEEFPKDNLPDVLDFGDPDPEDKK